MATRKQISEFGTLGEALTGSHIVHTKSIPGDLDRKTTVQDILDLVPDPSPASATMTASDEVVFADNTDSNIVKRATIAELAALLTIPTVVSDYNTNGGVNIGTFQVKWGSFDSITDDPQVVAFESAFSNACFYVGVTRLDGNSSLNIPLNAAPGVADFTINRKSDVDGTVPMLYFAAGH